MEMIRNRGLAGRARKAHYRSRAARLFTQQLIEDYLEPRPARRAQDRYIPIRGRSDFLPSVASMVIEEATHADIQLELPLTPGDDNGHRRDQSLKPSGAKGVTTRDAVIRFEPLARPGAKERSALTLRGFLFGCALGSGAAAALLLILRVVL